MVLSRVGRRAPAEGRVVESWRDLDEIISLFFSLMVLSRVGRRAPAEGRVVESFGDLGEIIFWF